MLNGHNTSDALRILHDELKVHLDNFTRRRKSFYLTYFKSFGGRAKHSIFNWTSSFYLIVCVSLLASSFFLQTTRDVWLLIELSVLVIFLLVNIAFSLYEEHLKLQEPVDKANKLITELTDCSRKHRWQTENYLNLNCPISQCISLQWTIRDSRVINLPCSLLVEGDVILLRPGQNVPAKCCSIKNYTREQEFMARDEVFNPPHNFVGLEGSHNLSSCSPLQPEPFILLETPFITAFEMFLENSTNKPAGVLDKEKHDIYSVACEQNIIPSIFVFMFCVNMLRYLLFSGVVGSWVDMLIILQVQVIFPLLAISFPVIWRLLNLCGSAKVLVAFENLRKTNDLLDPSQVYNNSWKGILFRSINLLLGECDHLPRTSNIVQSLGNLTSFCCIDKKGVLSWPNPSAEKLFFLTSNKKSTLKSPDSFVHHNAVHNSSEDDGQTQKAEESCSTCQVLNMTQDTKNYNSLFFDDFSWKNHISSLKPLGLGILLNTCNLKTTEQYTEFADHVKCMSLKQKEAVPVVNRRCFCELARQMGFSDQATDIFTTEDVFGIYQHDTSSVENKELIQAEKYKMPMPNVFCVLLKDCSTDTNQLFSQGMADLLLSMCTDYWDGSVIKPLGNVERKKIADFYHRNSMTSYCTAFSYRPFKGNVPLKSCNTYLEVSENLFGSLRHLETSFMNGDIQKPTPGNKECWTKIHSTSNISLASDDGLDSDSVPLQNLGNQIFIGMVTMQYQAKQEIVNLIERLELNCIRFVHFSKENELRSRGFSEKMGLEAGWNCHISLLGESEKAPLSSEKSFVNQKLFINGGQRKSFGSAPILKVDATSKVEKLDSPDEITNPVKSNLYQGVSKSLLVRKPSLNYNFHVGVKPKKQKKKLSNEIEVINPLLNNKKSEMSPSSSSSSLYSSYIEGLSEIQNRAQLPKGIENIRPHIDNIDNVPLQVSLFTDCTTSTTCEMLKILQEYGEVTCCFGSSLNMDNVNMFLKADCSISKDPVFPQICNQEKSCTKPPGNCIGPMQLSSMMQSLPCFLMFHQMDVSCFHKLISSAREHCQRIRSASRLFLSFQLCLSCLQLLNSLLFLPPCLSPQLILWLSVVVVPLFSLSMMSNPSFPQVTPTCQGKNQKKAFNQWMKTEVVGFSIRYLPTLLICIVVHAINLYEFCCIRVYNSTSCDCNIFFGERNGTSSNDWNGRMNDEDGSMMVSQHFTCLMIVLYFASISMCNVHRYSYLWKSSPLKNHLWISVALILIIVQMSWFSLNGKTSVSLAGWIISAFWIPLLIGLHEVTKKREIKVWIRHQKRARLDFGTKLGMNSPF